MEPVTVQIIVRYEDDIEVEADGHITAYPVGWVISTFEVNGEPPFTHVEVDVTEVEEGDQDAVIEIVKGRLFNHSVNITSTSILRREVTKFGSCNSLNIQEEDWENTGDGRFITTIYLYGKPFHLEAIEVYTDEQGIQRAKDDRCACEPDGHFMTATVCGKTCVLFAQPYSA